jgi:hypothetical protein|tara:strand:- start:686 stop:826 length:141 start_codon:yes stop_codon:yes gene_type:complete
MKIKITQPTFERKSIKMVNVKYSDSRIARIPSITIRKKNIIKTFYV